MPATEADEADIAAAMKITAVVKFPGKVYQARDLRHPEDGPGGI